MRGRSLSLVVCLAYAISCGGTDEPVAGSCTAEPCDCVAPVAPGCAPACESAELLAQDWPPESVALEDRVLELVNEHRAQGGCCGNSGCFAPAAPLAPSALLRASARRHARDMALNSFLSHESLDGGSAFDRMREAGFEACALAENVARSQAIAEAVVSSWMASAEHCENILWDEVRYLGVGHYRNADDAYEHYWVQNFGG